MKIEKKYKINKWENWSDCIYEAINDFFATKSYHPNILTANNHTFSQFDFMINIKPGEKQKIEKVNDTTGEIEKINENKEIKISGFKTLKADIDFAIDKSLNDKEFILIYDSDPEWGDNEFYPIPDNESTKTSIKVML